MPRSTLATTLLVLALPLTAVAQSAPARRTDADLLALGRTYSGWFFAGQSDSLFAHMTPPERQHMGAPGRLMEVMLSMTSQVGEEETIIDERVVTRSGVREYWREARFTNFSMETLVARWIFTDEGAISGVEMAPKSNSAALP
jgi:hypothetical protein